MVTLLAFVAVALVVFGIMALVMGSSHSQKLIEQRIMRIRVSKGELGPDADLAKQLLKSNQIGKMELLDDLLQKIKLSSYIKSLIVQSNLDISISMLLLYSVALAIFGFVVTSLCVSLLPIQILVACALGAVPIGIVSFKRSRRVAAFNAGLPDTIDMMARALRAGHSMVASINVVAEQSVQPLRAEFSEVFKQQNFGLPLRDALMQMMDRVPSQDLRVLVTGILVQKDTGGNLTEILDRTAAVIRDRLRIQGEIRTHTAQGRMTGYILCSLPVAMLGIINLVNPGYSSVLINTPFGHELLYIGMALLAIGGLIIRQIINGIEV
jgi:tight adherence protein B